MHPIDAPPSKKTRRGLEGDHSRDSQEFAASVDHIFITEGLASKKTGGKKAPLSCCECRRLKLKCDRTFPCASCKKRGCAEICPEGVLVSGKGTRFILANTEQLHKKIMEMSDRIRQLEEALEVLQSSYSSEPHVLMHPDLLNIKSAMGLYGSAQTGTDSSELASEIGNDDARPPYMDGNYMEIDSPEQTEQRMGESSKQATRISHDFLPESPGQLPAEIIRLSHIFPMSETISPESNPVLRGYIRSMLPSRSEAEYLWEQARQNALWQYNPHNNETFMPNLLHHVYSIPLDDLCPRRLALLLMILAVGCHVDLRQRGPGCPDAEKYHHLARAALCEIPVMEETNVETVTALFYEIWYLLVFSDDKKAAGYAWGLMGLTAKLAQSIGLHRNGVKSKVIPGEIEKRRSLFWELMYLDARLSLSLGRPPSLFLNHMDCKRPSYNPDGACDPSESLHYYQEWKHSCYVHCLAPVLEIQDRPLEYSIVIDLDKRIRDFSIPTPLRSGAAQSRSLIMQRASLSTALEAVLLQLHRTFFTRALSGPEEAINRSNQYAPSVVAVFLSASRMITTVQDLYRREPQLTARILWYWSNAFSAAVALCLLVSRAPFLCLSSTALQELEGARVLFHSARDTCPRALQVIPILETLVEKANNIYSRWANGQEVPTLVVLRRAEDSPASNGFNIASADYAKPFMTSPIPPDSFVHAHRSLSQCIEEVHQRVLSLFPTRKPCQCSATTSASCPPSHSWSLPPKFPHALQTTLSMPPEPRSGAYNGSYGAFPCDGRVNLPPISPISPTSRIAVVDSLNFDFGALNPNNDPSWMAWF